MYRPAGGKGTSLCITANAVYSGVPVTVARIQAFSSIVHTSEIKAAILGCFLIQAAIPIAQDWRLLAVPGLVLAVAKEFNLRMAGL
jgi:hypothetical protein